MSEFYGREFPVREAFNWRRFTRFARAAAGGADTSDMGSMVELDRLLDACLRPEDVDAFDALCDEHAPSPEKLMEFVAAQVAEVTERPTVQPANSSGGLRSITPNSTAGSSSPDTRGLVSVPGRPDLLLMQMERREALSVG